MKEILSYLTSHHFLTKEKAKETLTGIGKGNYSEVEIASFLTVFLMRPIQAQELAGFREALLDLCVPVDLSGFNTIDVCGTGGDSKNTFNISTLAAFVVAGAGVKVVKHGNYAVSSPCGSSNLIEHFGYKFSNDPEKLKKDLEKSNICYLHAPLFHPAMKYVAPVRAALRLKTFFNMLGPMVNPARPQNQLVGVYSPEVMELYHGVYKETGMNYTILNSEDGFDEISLTSDVHYISHEGNGKLAPEDFGFKKWKEEDLFGGGTIEEAAKIFMDILNEKGTEAQDEAILANAAMAIKTVHPGKSLDQCVEMAIASLKDGSALEAFIKFIG